jgi:hypothetical protein
VFDVLVAIHVCMAQEKRKAVAAKKDTATTRKVRHDIDFHCRF